LLWFSSWAISFLILLTYSARGILSFINSSLYSYGSVVLDKSFVCLMLFMEELNVEWFFVLLTSRYSDGSISMLMRPWIFACRIRFILGNRQFLAYDVVFLENCLKGLYPNTSVKYEMHEVRRGTRPDLRESPTFGSVFLYPTWGDQYSGVIYG
jgi:hypothetical protein